MNTSTPTCPLISSGNPEKYSSVLGFTTGRLSLNAAAKTARRQEIFKALSVNRQQDFYISHIDALTQQLPVNPAVQLLDVVPLADPGQVRQLRDATIEHFPLRGWLSICAFVWLVFGVVFAIDARQVNPLRGGKS